MWVLDEPFFNTFYAGVDNPPPHDDRHGLAGRVEHILHEIVHQQLLDGFPSPARPVFEAEATIAADPWRRQLVNEVRTTAVVMIALGWLNLLSLPLMTAVVRLAHVNTDGWASPRTRRMLRTFYRSRASHRLARQLMRGLQSWTIVKWEPKK